MLWPALAWLLSAADAQDLACLERETIKDDHLGIFLRVRASSAGSSELGARVRWVARPTQRVQWVLTTKRMWGSRPHGAVSLALTLTPAIGRFDVTYARLLSMQTREAWTVGWQPKQGEARVALYYACTSGVSKAVGVSARGRVGALGFGTQLRLTRGRHDVFKAQVWSRYRVGPAGVQLCGAQFGSGAKTLSLGLVGGYVGWHIAARSQLQLSSGVRRVTSVNLATPARGYGRGALQVHHLVSPRGGRAGVTGRWLWASRHVRLTACAMWQAPQAPAKARWLLGVDAEVGFGLGTVRRTDQMREHRGS